MGATESWYRVVDGVVYLHVENDGPGALRKGLEKQDRRVGTIEEIMRELEALKLQNYVLKAKLSELTNQQEK